MKRLTAVLKSSNFASSSSAPAPKPTTISSPIVNTPTLGTPLVNISSTYSYSSLLTLISIKLGLDPNADFWKNIKTLSATTYDNEETSVLVDTLEELLDDRMANFSLDDLELLAASMLRPSH